MAYEWWRFVIYKMNNNYQYQSIGDIAMRDSLNGNNLCVGGTAFASSYYNDYGLLLTPDKAFNGLNGSINDIWHISGSEYGKVAHIGYHFLTPVDIQYFDLSTRVDNVNGTWIEFDLEYSSDGVNWFNRTKYRGNPPVAAGTTVSFGVYDLSLSIIPTNLLSLSRASVTSSASGVIVDNLVLKSHLHGGKGVVSGTTVKVPSDIPVARKVRLFEEKSGLLIQEVWSDAAGNYSFVGLSDNYYFITAHDHTLEFNGVIQSHVRPEFPV